MARKKTDRIALIINPMAGAMKKRPDGVGDVLGALRALGFEPETRVVEHGHSAADSAQELLALGHKRIAVCGGDGTVSAAAGALMSTRAAIAILPAGSMNNLAVSLGIPQEIPAAATLVREGRVHGVDVGMACCAGISRHFMELCSVGLISELSPSGESLQHGNIISFGEFLSTLVSATPSDMAITLDGHEQLRGAGHIMLAVNTPVAGYHYRLASEGSLRDGKLDVLFFNGFSKLDLLGFAADIRAAAPEDPRLVRGRATNITIEADPPMPVMADGCALGMTPVEIEVKKGALKIVY